MGQCCGSQSYVGHHYQILSSYDVDRYSKAIMLYCTGLLTIYRICFVSGTVCWPCPAAVTGAMWTGAPTDRGHSSAMWSSYGTRWTPSSLWVNFKKHQVSCCCHQQYVFSAQPSPLWYSCCMWYWVGWAQPCWWCMSSITTSGWSGPFQTLPFTHSSGDSMSWGWGNWGEP